MAKAILFDLDGTLTDSGEGIMNCAAYALEHFGIPVPPRQELRKFVGPPLTDNFRSYGIPEDRLEKDVAVYRSRYIPIGKYENFPYDGIELLLQKLRQLGHRLFVATSKPEALSIEILEHFGLAPYFEIIAGAGKDGVRDKKSEVIAYLLEQIDGYDGIVMVGDTKFDIIGAAAHKIPAIGVSWGYGDVEEMDRCGAVSIAHTMDELYELLK